MTPTTRFAPSPTGLLHVGNARTALVNWLVARAGGGRFVLRFDDTDADRSAEGFAAAIERDLAWLGLDWDGVERQSRRIAAYEAAAERLRAAGRLYACYETPDELEAKRRSLRARRRPPVYDRAGLGLSDAERAAYEAEGRRPHWRFRLDDAEVAWNDVVRGPVRLHAANLSDPVVVRADGSFLYMLPSTVDDIEMGVDPVIRGEDHVDNTALQIQMFEALGAAPPAFAHLPLLADIDGKGLSKRIGSLTLASLRDDGIEPMALASLLAQVGTADAVELRDRMEALIGAFDLARIGRATPKFDDRQLRHLNARLLHEMPFDEARERLAARGLGRADARFWAAVRPNLETIADAEAWYAVAYGDAEPVVEDADFAATAARLLPAEPWDDGTWGAWTAAVREATGRKGASLYRPLRLALTGADHGPELGLLLPLVGRERALRRLTQGGR